MNQLSIVTDRERELAERLRVAEQQRDELAAQVEVMRDALQYYADPAGCVDSDGERVGGFELAQDAISRASDSAAILRQRDARTLRVAADELHAIADDDGPEHSWGTRACAYSSAADKLNAKADELERKNA